MSKTFATSIIANRPNAKVRLFALFVVSLLLLGLGLVLPVHSATTNQTITASRVTGSDTVNGLQDESFWSQVPSQTVSLAPSNQFGGKESSVTIQAANNGTWLFLFAKWSDSSQNRLEMTAIKGNQTGQYFTNSTYYYADLFFVDWWMGSGAPDQSPFATSQPGGGGHPTGWSASDKQNIWNWRSYFTDQGAPGYPNIELWPTMTPESYSFGSMKGETIVVPHSWAWDLYMNSTGNYLLDDGMFHSVSCVVQTPDPYTVWARGVWSNGVWSLEMARPFTPPSPNKDYSMSFSGGQSYYVSFAAANGGAGEVQATNSISQWLTLTIEGGGQSFFTEPLFYGSVIAAAIIIIVVIAVLVVRSRTPPPTQPAKS